MYKILFGLVDVTATDFFTFFYNSHSTRGHPFKLIGGSSRINARQHYFTERVVNPWNALTIENQDVESVASFKKCLLKNNLDAFMVTR